MTFLVIYSKMSFYPDKICHIQQNSRQMIRFCLKSHHFRTYFLYMIKYNNVSRPVHGHPATIQPLHPQPSRIDTYDRDTFNILLLTSFNNKDLLMPLGHLIPECTGTFKSSQFAQIKTWITGHVSRAHIFIEYVEAKAWRM